MHESSRHLVATGCAGGGQVVALNHLHELLGCVPDLGVILAPQVADFEVVPAFLADVKHLAAEAGFSRRPVVHQRRVLAHGDGRVAGQRGKGHQVRVDLLQCLFPSVTQHVHHGHATL